MTKLEDLLYKIDPAMRSAFEEREWWSEVERLSKEAREPQQSRPVRSRFRFKAIRRKLLTNIKSFGKLPIHLLNNILERMLWDRIPLWLRNRGKPRKIVIHHSAFDKPIGKLEHVEVVDGALIARIIVDRDSPFGQAVKGYKGAASFGGRINPESGQFYSVSHEWGPELSLYPEYGVNGNDNKGQGEHPPAPMD